MLLCVQQGYYMYRKKYSEDIHKRSKWGLLLDEMCIKWAVVMSSRYVVTFSPLMDTKEDPQAIIIWDILTGQKKRGFHCESSAHWPIFKSVHCACRLKSCSLQCRIHSSFSCCVWMYYNGSHLLSDGATMESSLLGWPQTHWASTRLQ